MHAWGGELTLTKLGNTPMKDGFPPEKHERIITAHLKSGYIELSATDWMAAPAYELHDGDIFAIFVLAEGYDELKAVCDKLSEDVQTDRFQELHDLSFVTDGQFCDSYGYHWIVKGDKTA